MKSLILLLFFASCAPPENGCKKKYQEVIVDCKLGAECKRVLVEICE
jgi:hypothetical protein